MPAPPALAVLPFLNATGDPSQDYFADGVVDDIITALSRFKSFAVVSRNSSFAYRNNSDGGQRHSSWARTLDGELNEIFDFQETI